MAARLPLIPVQVTHEKGLSLSDSRSIRRMSVSTSDKRRLSPIFCRVLIQGRALA